MFRKLSQRNSIAKNKKNAERKASTTRLPSLKLNNHKSLSNIHSIKSITNIQFKIKQISAQNQQWISAKSYGVYTSSLQPLIQFKAHQKREIASLTKIMTLLVSTKLAHKYKVNIHKTYFRVSVSASNINGTIAQLQPREYINIYDLLHALMLPSGNDAALVLSQNFGAFIHYDKLGEANLLSEIKSLDVTDDGAGKLKLYTDYFVKAMNQTAKELKMNYTFFMNPHGLDTKEAYSCVHDLSILMSYIMSQFAEEVMNVMSARIYRAQIKMKLGKQTRVRQQQWLNTHKLLWKQGYMGGKTGQTLNAGNCLSTVYRKNNKDYIIIVLGCQNREKRFTETEKLISKAINSF